ncbi:DUF3800 domain-containing protein [Bacillus cereus]|uniref:DUF3800 domain-containing protein n=1 Tax=Bacillus cereus TaxID=1396 RepID=UPI001925BEEB|nr:DUF3800 domain-containing protein [Bacillus cereus]MBL3890740.1 DUF3800 domain-containing protein [Bacillus cereus]
MSRIRPKKKKYVLYIDETGISSSSNFFGMLGVVFTYKYSVDEQENSELTTKLNDFKNECFGREDLTLHLIEILGKQKQFDFLTDEQVKTFFDKVPDFLKGLDFHIISVTVDRRKLLQYYGSYKDPYEIAFIYILDMYYSMLSHSDVDSGRVVIESRDDNQNLRAQRAFFDVFINGTTHQDFSIHREKIKGFIIAKKGDNLYGSGLEISDLLCNPISRVRQGLVELKQTNTFEYGNENRIFQAVKSKIYSPRSMDDMRNWGFKKVPILKKERTWNDFALTEWELKIKPSYKKMFEKFHLKKE